MQSSPISTVVRAGAPRRFGQRRPGLLMLALVAGTALSGPGLAQAAGAALPTGGRVVSGQASIATPSGNTLAVSQASAKAIIDWTSFSIGQGGAVRVDNGSGATLNRVTGQSLSSIDGVLSATGSVYLINPNGVIVGKTGVVKVGGSFVASALDVSDATFMAGGPLTFAGPSTASVVNLGKVGALGGDVALIAATVANAGSISAPNGSAGLLSGAKVILTDAGLDGGRFAVALPATGGSVTNSGAIEAATAELRANGGDVYALAGDTSGVIRATGISAGGGRIWLVAEGGTAHVAGTLDAQGADGTPGAIETSGSRVDLGATLVDAHGGRWLLDPTNLEITSAGASTISSALATTDVTQTTTGDAGAGAGDITLDTGAAIAWGSTHALTLSAYHDVNLQGTITLSGAGTLNLRADNAAAGSGTVKVTGAAGQVTLASGATANLYYNPVSYTDTATRSTQQGVAIPTVEVYTNPYSNPYDASNPGQTVATSAPVMGGTVRAYMLVDNLGQLGGGLTGVGSQLNGLYALNADIDATSTKTANPVTGMSGTYFGFIPIGYTGSGNTTNNFTGVFDGQNHTISNLYINHFTLDSNGNRQNTDAAGIFGVASGNDAGAVFVENLNVPNATVIGSGAQNGIVAGVLQSNAVGSNLVTSGTVTGYRSGGVAGQLYGNGSIQNSHSSATINAGNVTDESGGLVGENYGGFLSNDYATGAVNGGAYVGGLVGSDNGNITNSYATGAVTATGSHVGGLAGSLFGAATNAYATGSVTDTGAYSERIGGWAGDGGGTWTNVSATGAVTVTDVGANQVGGLVGRLGEDSTLSGAFATGALTITADTTRSNVGSFGGLIGRAQPGFNISNSFATGAVKVNGGSVGGLIGTAFAGTLTMSYASGAVSGLGSVGGLIGASTDYGKNAQGLSVTDSYATGSVTGTGTAANAANAYLGGLIGSESHDEGTAGATLTLTRTYAIGAVSGAGVAGGLVGLNAGVISNSLWDRTTTGQTSGVGATATSFSTSNPPTISVANLTSVQDTAPTAADYAFSATPYVNAGFQFGATPGGKAGATTETWVQIDNDSTFNGANGAAIGTRPFLLMEYASNISNVHQLELMNLAKSAAFTLTADIDASQTATTANMWGPNGFAPIGNSGGSAVGFTGSLQGGGHAISGLTESQSALLSAGLFGAVGLNQTSTNSVIANLTLTGANITGGGQAGALAGYANAAVSNVTASGSVSGQAAGGLVGFDSGPIANASAAVKVTSVGGSNTNIVTAAGGLVGEYNGTTANSLSNVSASGAVSGIGRVGGLVGYAHGSVAVDAGRISNAFATGAVVGTGDSVGGLVGELSFAFLSDGYATGAVTGGTRVGGLVGYDNGLAANDLQITGSAAGKTYASGAVTGTGQNSVAQTLVGGLVGENKASLALASYAPTGAGVSGAGDAVGGLVGMNDAGASIIVASSTGAVAGVNSVGGLVGLNLGAVSGSFATGGVMGGSFVGGLVGLNASTVQDSYATGAVKGSGNGTGGLVGQNSPINDSTATPTITGSAAGKTYASGSVSGSGSVGGLVGQNQGVITLASYTPASVGVSGASFTGGLAGYNNGVITNGSAAGSVTGAQYTGGLVGLEVGGALRGSTSSATVSGTTSVGGLVGAMGLLLDYSSGAVFTPAEVSTSSATGSVTAQGAGAGGLVGVNTAGTITDSFATGPVSGGSQVGGLVGASLNDTTSNPGTTYTASITGSAAGKTYASGAVTGAGAATGGLVGENAGTITRTSYINTSTGVHGTADGGGVVGLNDAGATVANVMVAAPVSSTSYTGGLIGDNLGSLTSGDYTGVVTGGAGVGGVVGVNEAGGMVTGSTAAGTSAAFSVIGAGDDVGGVAGANFGVLGTTASPVGADTMVSGRDHVGGVVGYNSGPVFGSYYGVISGRDYVGGLGGLNFSAITGGSSGAVQGRSYVGGAIGWNEAQGALAETAVYATVAATGDYVGGLVGVNKGSLASVNYGDSPDGAHGSVSGSRIVGGLVGLNQGAITYGSAVAPVTGDQDVGGLVGWNDTGATISKSYATGAVTGRLGGEDATTHDDYVGGLIGVNFGAASDVYATGGVSGVQVVGGLVGTNMPGGGAITNAYATGVVSASRGAVGGFAGVQGGSLRSVYYQPAASGQASGVGYAAAAAAPTAIGPGTTYDANAQATYQGFDFFNTWQANANSPPTLKGATR